MDGPVLLFAVQHRPKDWAQLFYPSLWRLEGKRTEMSVRLAGAQLWGTFSGICALFQTGGLQSKFAAEEDWSGSAPTPILAMDYLYLLMYFSLNQLLLDHIFAADTHGKLSFAAYLWFCTKIAGCWNVFHVWHIYKTALRNNVLMRLLALVPPNV